VIGHSFGCREIVRYLSRHGSARIVRAALVAPTLPFLLKTADNPSGIDHAVVNQLTLRRSNSPAERPLH
jgi:predicted alpha/beta hydrolase family esterase